jgi:transmembrane sensor
MAPKTASPPINTQIYAAAADWLVKHRECDLDEPARRAFDLWLRISPEHIRAYLELSALWEDFSLLHIADTPASSDLVARLGKNRNVIPLEPREPPSGQSSPATSSERSCRNNTTPHWRSWRFALAASLLMTVALTAMVTWTTRDPSYATAVGEQRTIKLADGSTVELNSASRVHIHFSRQQRSVELAQGQALFQVAKDRTRPFVVTAGTARVRAVGTQFDVYQKRSATVVTVLEGQVAITPEAAAPVIERPSEKLSGESAPEPLHLAVESEPHPQGTTPILLSAGQQLTLTRDQVKQTPRADLAAATAWTQHHIVFTDSPLNEVVEEFNRYNTRRLVIADPELESFRINGVFSSADPAVLLRFLRSQSDIEIEETDTAIRISHR